MTDHINAITAARPPYTYRFASFVKKVKVKAMPQHPNDTIAAINKLCAPCATPADLCGGVRLLSALTVDAALSLFVERPGVVLLFRPLLLLRALDFGMLSTHVPAVFCSLKLPVRRGLTFTGWFDLWCYFGGSIFPFSFF